MSNPIPWKNGTKYLVNRLINRINSLQDGTIAKIARYIARNCQLMQEFWFAHPELKCKLNKIFNSSFPGSVLWDLTSDNVSSIINRQTLSSKFKHLRQNAFQGQHRFLNGTVNSKKIISKIWNLS